MQEQNQHIADLVEEMEEHRDLLKRQGDVLKRLLDDRGDDADDESDLVRDPKKKKKNKLERFLKMQKRTREQLLVSLLSLFFLHS